LILRAGQGNLSRAKRHHDPSVGQYVQTSRHPSFPEIQRSNALAAADSLDFLRRHSRRRSSSLLGVSCPPASEKGQKIGNQFTFIELVDDLAMPIPNATTNRAHSIQLRSNITLDSGRERGRGELARQLSYAKSKFLGLRDPVVMTTAFRMVGSVG
jgi:hypothetical protein